MAMPVRESPVPECASEYRHFSGKSSWSVVGILRGYLSDKKTQLCVISDGRLQDTDATARYSRNATGFYVRSRNGQPIEERFAVTTRTDGFIDINIELN